MNHTGLDELKDQLFISLIISALLIGLSIAILADKGPRVWDISAIGFFGFLISAVLGIYICIFENNSATENGGAIYESNATGCTFSNNTAEETGRVAYGGIISDCTFELNFAGIAGTENYDENITIATDCTSAIIGIIASDFETSYGFNKELPLTIKDDDGKIMIDLK